MKTDKVLIYYLLKAHASGKKASSMGICYTHVGGEPEASRTFSIEIDDVQYSLHANKLADFPNGGSDELLREIKDWVNK